jgi:outer membrane biosynthesis protein TonB
MRGTSSHAAKLSGQDNYFMLLPFLVFQTNTFAMRPNDSFIKPKLPKALLDQIGGDTTNNKKNATTRKERRKNERTQKKQSHQQSRSRPPPQRPQPQRRPQPQPQQDEFDESDDEPAPPPAPKPKSKPAKEDKPKSILKTTKKPDPARSKAQEDSPPPSVHVSRAVKDRLAQDDAEIASLEKKLGIKSTKRSKAFQDDGLEDLLEGLDDEEDDDGPKRKRSDDDDWLRQKRRKVSQAAAVAAEPSDDDEEDEDEDMSGDEDELDGLDDIMDGLGESDEDGDLDGLEDDDEDEEEDDDLEEGSDDDMNGEKFEDFDEDDEDSEEEAPAPRVRENPYSCTRRCCSGSEVHSAFIARCSFIRHRSSGTSASSDPGSAQPSFRSKPSVHPANHRRNLPEQPTSICHHNSYRSSAWTHLRPYYSTGYIPHPPCWFHGCSLQGNWN